MKIVLPMDSLALEDMPEDSWEKRVVAWRSRRGILELDLILIPFVDACYDSLNQDDQRMHQWLLSQKDQLLQRWLVLRNGTEHCSVLQKKYITKVWTFIDGYTP